MVTAVQPHGETGPARPSRHTLAGVAAIAVTSMVLVTLVTLKVATRPAWRASARTEVTSCMGGYWSVRSADRLHRTVHLARCLARLEPVGTDYLELGTAGLLIMLLVGEVRLLARNHGSDDKHDAPSAAGAAGPDRREVRRVPGPRTNIERSVTDEPRHHTARSSRR